MKRREFLKYMGLSAGATAFPQILSAAVNTSFTDFKAIVLVNLQGGNDALNTFIPTGSGEKTGYTNYVKQRGSSISIPDNDLMGDLRNLVTEGSLEIGSAAANPYYVKVGESDNYMKGLYLLDQQGFGSEIAVNGMMPELAYWMDAGRGAVIQNIGNISGPYTKSELLNDKKLQPSSLFAHNVQGNLMQLGMAKGSIDPKGWLGLLADQWGNVNGPDGYKMNIDLSTHGINPAMFGATSRPMNYSYLGPKTLDSSINDDFESWINSSTPQNLDSFRKLFRELRKKVYTETNTTAQDWEELNKIDKPFDGITDAYGNKIYNGKKVSKAQMGMHSPINDRVVESFKTAAKLIAIAKKKGFNRIVLSIIAPGFDQHSNLKGLHSIRIRGLSVGLDAFMRAMDAKGWLDEVVVASVSEFSRSTAGNNDGSDHAWGGSQFVLGAVNPGNFGEFPDLDIAGPQDISRRGRLIPTTSYSQYYGKLLKWFGASDHDIDIALPELKNFTSASTASKLGFMKGVA